MTSTSGTRFIKVATYNIHRCVGLDYRYDSKRIVRVLREIDCDVICLQEVDNRAGRGHDSLQLDFLAEQLDMQPIPGMRILRHLGEYGNAVLTRYPARQVRRHDLSFKNREPRGALDVELDIHGQTMRVVATHLGLARQEREYQSRALVELLEARSEAEFLVLAGDFNDWMPRAESLRALNSHLGLMPARASFPSGVPVFALDRIWVRPTASLRVLRAHGSWTARWASDHLPVVAELSWPADP